MAPAALRPADLWRLPCRHSYLVSQHPEVEAKIAGELGEKGLLAVQGSPNPRGLQLSDIHDLPYLSAALKVPAASYSSTNWSFLNSNLVCVHRTKSTLKSDYFIQLVEDQFIRV